MARWHNVSGTYAGIGFEATAVREFGGVWIDNLETWIEDPKVAFSSYPPADALLNIPYPVIEMAERVAELTGQIHPMLESAVINQAKQHILWAACEKFS